METYKFLLDLCLILLSTKVLGLLTRKFSMPQVVGALLAGVILGPGILGIITPTDFISDTAEVGVIVLMFCAGMETDVQELKKSGKSALIIALIGVLVPLVGGYAVAAFFNRPGMLESDASCSLFLQNVFIGVILTATSGDTGKAALAGFADVPGTKIIVFYPKGGVSHVQELQMVTQKGENTSVVAIHGNFDNAQSGVKAIFEDKELAAELDAKGYQFSSANSINIGRLVPQVVYYVYAYAKLLENEEIQAGEEINVTVPTGNFGNILAAYYAKQMGVPIAKLICASNDNKVLFDFFQTGVYDRNREFILTSSPSMDILISSNLERLIYTIAGQDAQKDVELMTQLKEKGVYEITAEMKEGLKDFVGGFATEEEVKETIHDTYQKTGYVMDTHTAVAAHVCAQYRKDTKDEKKCLVASTASPYKFVRNVMTAIDPKYDEMEDFALIDELEKVSGFPIPNAIKEIRDAEVRHTTECDADQMKETVKNILGV